MKILLISLLGRGGMLHYTSQLANSLSEKSEVSVILPGYASTEYFTEKVKIIKVLAPPSIIKVALSTAIILPVIKIVRQINKNGYDVIHIVNTHPWNIFICALGDRHVKKVFTLHDPIAHEQGGPIKLFQFVNSITNWTTIKWSNKVIVHGKKLKSDCVKVGMPDEKIVVIPHGDYAFFGQKIATEDKRYAFPGKKIVLFFGRIEHYKGIQYFINAAADINGIIPDTLFIIAGDGNFKPYEKFVHSDNILIINKYISDEEVAALFSASRLVVLPYISATQSGVIPIAYAFKKPVIATDVGSIPEVIDNGSTGFIVPARDIAALKAAIVTLLNDEALARKMGENAYSKMKNELSWEVVSSKTIKIYSDTERKAVISHPVTAPI